MTASADPDTTYYISPYGDDARTATEAQNPLTPWRTISHAVEQASSGDTIKVMDDNVEATDDYVENVIIPSEKSNLTIERHNAVGPNPQVKAANSSVQVF